jgi:molybdopterin synthase catalytic subunit
MASQKAPPIQGASFLEEENIHVELTQDLLNVTQVMNRVKSPKAGAVVLFSGITLPIFPL